jgi:hypothetical protein
VATCAHHPSGGAGHVHGAEVASVDLTVPADPHADHDHHAHHTGAPPAGDTPGPTLDPTAPSDPGAERCAVLCAALAVSSVALVLNSPEAEALSEERADVPVVFLTFEFVRPTQQLFFLPLSNAPPAIS